MPCTVSQEEADFYEREFNKRDYGKELTNPEVTTAVACEATKLLEKHGLLNQCSGMLRKWLIKHKEEDRNR